MTQKIVCLITIYASLVFAVANDLRDPDVELGYGGWPFQESGSVENGVSNTISSFKVSIDYDGRSYAGTFKSGDTEVLLTAVDDPSLSFVIKFQ